jgi:GTP cyclohydrolase II
MLAVERGVAELRRGRPLVVIGGEGQAVLVQAAEATTPDSLALVARASQGVAAVAITARRAAVLGLAPPGLRAVLVGLARPGDGPLPAALVYALADPLADAPLPVGDELAVSQLPAHACEVAAIQLARIGRLLPAVVAAPIRDALGGGPAGPCPIARDPVARDPFAWDPVAWAARHGFLVVDAGDIFQYDYTQARTLKPVSEAEVPLLGAEQARIIAFRPLDGGLEHLAVRIGDPRPPAPVLTRLHSECFTGDLLGSLRCDCGDQLRGAIREIAAGGGGLLLYLAQEGRGIGLVNKLRAYTLQDRGFDTLDANGQLGFDDDERVYLPAAQMLRQLGFGKVRLLTNNPAKVDALVRLGIDVLERVPHAFPTNRHNERYLQTKAAKSGHLL